MATKKTTAKKLAEDAEEDVKEEAAEAAEEEAPAEKRSKKDKLTLTASPAQANFQFSVEVDGLDPLQSADLTMFNPSGGMSGGSVQASPEGKAQWLLLATEAGEHDLSVSAEGKRTVEETIDVAP